mgnify:FL=1
MVRAFVQRHGLSPTLTALVLSALTVLMAVRFIGLTEAPPGFYVDEAAIAAQIICVRTTGADADGNPWPLFADVLGGGQVSPPTLYLGALWTALLGDGVASFRSLAGAAGVVILISLALVTWRLGAQPLAVPAILLIAASSPWLFHLLRVFWDPIIAAATWAAALAAYVFASRSAVLSGRVMGWLAFALLSAAAIYGYPPLRRGIASQP